MLLAVSQETHLLHCALKGGHLRVLTDHSPTGRLGVQLTILHGSLHLHYYRDRCFYDYCYWKSSYHYVLHYFLYCFYSRLLTVPATIPLLLITPVVLLLFDPSLLIMFVINLFLHLPAEIHIPPIWR